MALSNAQYDQIMREYDQKQLRNRRLTFSRLGAAYASLPRLKEIDDAIASCSITQAKKRLEGDTNALLQLKEQLAAYRNEKAALLKEEGYDDNYFEPLYDCKDCKDTGYIDGKKCHCFQQAIINKVYAQSNIKNILERENFNEFRLDYYSDSEVDPITERTPKQTAVAARAACENFVETFDDKPKNLFFYGNTGVGKTFLTNCIAKELLDKGYSVIYFTAFQLFDILSKGVFEKDADAIEAHKNIFDCDLLIIDDLGTEFSNSFTTSQLFLCVNERILRQKSTIISTNLSMNQMLESYSERTLSRISSNYTVLKLHGEDIRIKKRKIS